MLSILLLSGSMMRGISASSELQRAMQQVVNDVTRDFNEVYNLGVAMQIGFSNANETFAVAAGHVTVNNATRAITPDDTMLYGSGTKPFTAAAVMRLVDAKVIGAGDRASKYVDPYLRRSNGTTLEKLFGRAAANATVLDIIRMAGGIPDFESTSSDPSVIDPYDNMLLAEGDRIWEPYAFIRHAAEQPIEGPSVGHLYCNPEQNGIEGTPGRCQVYSSTSFEVAGLLLAAVTGVDDWMDLDLLKLALPVPERYDSLTFLGAKAMCEMVSQFRAFALCQLGRMPLSTSRIPPCSVGHAVALLAPPRTSRDSSSI